MFCKTSVSRQAKLPWVVYLSRDLVVFNFHVCTKPISSNPKSSSAHIPMYLRLRLYLSLNNVSAVYACMQCLNLDWPQIYTASSSTTYCYIKFYFFITKCVPMLSHTVNLATDLCMFYDLISIFHPVLSLRPGLGFYDPQNHLIVLALS